MYGRWWRRGVGEDGDGMQVEKAGVGVAELPLVLLLAGAGFPTKTSRAAGC